MQPPHSALQPGSAASNAASQGLSQASDQALLTRYRQGDRGAFRSLVRRHGERLYNFVLRNLGSALVADGVTHDVFLSLVADPAAFSREGGFRTRLFQVAVAQCRRHAPSGVRAPSPLEPLAGEQAEEDAIRAAVDDLPETSKEVFLLREVAGLGFAEIAQVLGQSEVSVKVAMHQALKRLQERAQHLEAFRSALYQQDRRQSSTR